MSRINRAIQITLGVTILLTLPLASLVAVNVLVLEPAATSANLLLMTVQAALVLALLRFSPMWPKHAHPMWPIACLGWGAIGSVGLSLLISMPTEALVLKLGWVELLYSFAGAYPEEITKAVGVLMILACFRGLDRPWHGLLTGMLVGMAFDVFENFGYATQGGLSDPESDLFGVALTWGFRTVFGPGLHMMFAGFVGYGLGLALFTLGRSTRWRIGVAVFWFLFDFTSHFVWNLVVSQYIYGIIFVVLVTYPTFISLFVVSWRQARRDSGYLMVKLPTGYSPELSTPAPTSTAVTHAPHAAAPPGSGMVPLPLVNEPT